MARWHHAGRRRREAAAVPQEHLYAMPEYVPAPTREDSTVSALTPTGTGQRVVSITDDSTDPLIGRIVGWEDEDRAIVAWGDERFKPAAEARTRIVAIDEITPIGGTP